MDRANAALLGQLVRTLKGAVVKLEDVYTSGDSERVEDVKKEILTLQRRIASML
jgi:hypothetical protein